MVILLFLVFTPNSVWGMCPEPNPVINAYRHKDDNFLEEGSWLNYTCYMNCVHYSGHITRQCFDGIFTGQPPVCIVSCGPPPVINSMITEIPDFTLPGSIVNYTCQFNTSIQLTAVCDTNSRKWMYDDTIICPKQGNLFESLRSGEKHESWANFFYDNRTETCRQSNVSTQPNMNLTMFKTVDLLSISVTFGAFTGAHGKVIVKLKSSKDQSNTTHIIGTCGGIFEHLNDNETILIECAQPSYGTVVNIEMVLEPGVTDSITVCEFKTVGNLRNESCYGQPMFSYGAEITQRNYEIIRQKCVEGFYWLLNMEIVKCQKKIWSFNKFECARRDDLIPMKPHDVQHSFAFDQTRDTCKKLNESTLLIMGGDAYNRTFVVLSVTVMLLDNIKDGIGVKVIKSNGDQSECYFTNLWFKMLLCDFEDNTEANTIVFYNNSTANTEVRLCELYVNGFYKDTNDHECYRSHPSNYQGKMNFTWNDLTCERWDQVQNNLNFNVEHLPDETVKEAENYCRNPDNSALVPWCFVKNYTEKANCMVQKCSLYCSLSADGIDYKGKQIKTSTSEYCEKWSDIKDIKYVQEYKEDINTRRCRNFGDSFSSPWCFTNVSGQSFGACSTIHCAKTINTIQLSQPSMVTDSILHPYCYWSEDTNMPFFERYEMTLNQYALQTRCLDGVKSVFCYGESDGILTRYHVDSCDAEATETQSTTNLPIPATLSNANTDLVTLSSNSKTLPNMISSYVTINVGQQINMSVSNTLKLLPNITDLPLDLNDELCNCICVESKILNDVTLDKRIEDIIASLSVEKSNLTSVMRRKTSANDKRPSVIYIGSGAVAIFSIFILLIVLPDVFYLVKGVVSVFKNCRKYQNP